jgi:hypothetical protein
VPRRILDPFPSLRATVRGLLPTRWATGCGRFVTHIGIHNLDDPRMVWPEILNRSIGQDVRIVGGMKL